MKRLISLLVMLFTLTVFISPNNYIIRESQYITKDKISTKKSVNIPIIITDDRIIIYSTATQIYNYIVFIISPAGIGRPVAFVNQNQRNIRLTFIKEEKS